MPHSSFFSRAVGYQSDGGRTKPRRNKLKKRAPFGYSETNYVSYDLSNLMGNRHSIEDVPRPMRPPRPSTTDLPDLPGLPIYKTFATELKPATVLDDGPPPPPFSDEQQPSESATGWVLADSGPTPAPMTTTIPERQVKPSGRLLDRQEAGFDIPQVPQRPPQYDRASRLAESYQCLLPDLDSLDYPESHSALQRQHSDHTLRNTSTSSRDHWHHKYNPRNSGRFSPPLLTPPAHHSLRHTANQRPGTAPAPEHSVAPSWHPVPHSAFGTSSYPPQASNRRGGNSGDTHSILTDSSTAVESDNSPTDRFSTASEMVFPTHGVKAGLSNPFGTDTCESPSSSENDSFAKKEKEPRSGGRITSSDYVGLQICSELLTDELLKTFFRRHPTENRAKASKLQVLLLIEAYEAMLDSCRRELLDVPPSRSAGVGRSAHDKGRDREHDRERIQRRKHIRDAVRILDHWLDSLYVIYDDTFGDLPGEEYYDGMENEEVDKEKAKCEADYGRDPMTDEQCNRVHLGEMSNEGDTMSPRTNMKGIKGILRSNGVPSQAQVPVQPAPTATGSRKLFRGWNRGVGF
ncbi:hypothetical protein V8F20_012770 [Naviculisporaceae sp. PSN 640]